MTASQEPPELAINPASSRSRILLVDDHEQGRKALARLLGAVGFDVTAVNDATSAFEALRGPDGFDYVLTDLRLPDFDGRDVVHAARQLIPTPRISLITGWDIDPDETHRLGVDYVFLKPINLQDMVAKLLAPSARPNASGF